MKKAIILLAMLCVVACSDKPAETHFNALSDAQKSLENKTAPPPATNGISCGTFTDSRDSKKYKAVKIGSQTWMAENLNYAANGSKCYDNKPENCAKYGRLYNWATAKKICPSGWHLPSDAEWNVLMSAIGGKETAGKKLKAKSGWNNYEGKSGNGTDEFGFSALPGGLGLSDGIFGDVGNYGLWWSATEGNASDVYYRLMYNNYGFVLRYYYDKSGLFSVRCLQD